MESQRVKLLTEGYLRGWLNFTYPNTTSQLREELILSHLHEERLYGLLLNKLFVDTSMIANSPSNSGVSALTDILRSLIGLKLPSSLPKDTIKKELSSHDLSEWKSFLEKVNKK